MIAFEDYRPVEDTGAGGTLECDICRNPFPESILTAFEVTGYEGGPYEFVYVCDDDVGEARDDFHLLEVPR